MDGSPTFGQWVKQRRAMLGLTRAAVAARSGYALDTIRKIERNLHRPSRELALRLLQALEVPPDDLPPLLRHARHGVDAGLVARPQPSLAARANLPPATTSFVGRQPECADLRRLLDTQRLISVVGAGGVGKTRLVAQLAGERADRYADGVWLVDLAPLADGAGLAGWIAQALNIREAAGHSREQTLLAALQPQHCLLILDNCEHLIAACAEVVTAMLAACAQLSVVITSREPLGVWGEGIYPVLPLAVPAAQANADELMDSAALQLFVARMGADIAPAGLSPPSIALIAELCRRIDGIPLAIELVAAHLATVPLEQMADSLDQHQLRIASPATIMPARHHTLAASIDWSYQLLTDAERQLLRWCAVFVNGWTLALLEAIWGDHHASALPVVSLLANLVDKSLVMTHETPAATRYSLLETVRQFAWEELAARSEIALLRDRQLDGYCAYAEQGAAHLLGEQRALWIGRLAAERANVYAALEWSLQRVAAADGVPDTPDPRLLAALGLAGGFWRIWDHFGQYTEGHGWLERVLAAIEQHRATHAAIIRDPLLSARYAEGLLAAGNLAQSQGLFVPARRRYAESFSLYGQIGHHSGCVMVLNRLAWNAQKSGEIDQAHAYLAESCRLARLSGDAVGLAQALNSLSMLAKNAGQLERAQEYGAESLALFQQAKHATGYPVVLNNLGAIAFVRHDIETAAALFAESLAVQQRHGYQAGVALGLNNLGLVAWRQQRLQAAGGAFFQSLLIRRQLGARLGMISSLVGLALVAWRLAAQAPAAGPSRRDLWRRALWIAAAVQRDAIASVDTYLRQLLGEMLADLRQQAPPALFRAAWVEGERMALTAVVQQMIEDSHGGWIRLEEPLGQPPAAAAGLAAADC